MLTFSSTHRLSQICRDWISAGLWKAWKTISHICSALRLCCISTSSQSNVVCAFLPTELTMFTYLKVVLPCSYCSQLLILQCSVFPHVLHQAVRSSGSLLSLLSHLAVMLCSSASLSFVPLSPAVKIQQANPRAFGIPPFYNDVYLRDSIRAESYRPTHS